MKIKVLTDFIETFAPPALQEDYDNAGLSVGRGDADCTGALICLDVTEEIIDEAIANKCNLVISHHPAIFRGLKKINGKNYTERIILKAIKNDIALYAAHTNLDNVQAGVNGKIAEVLGLENTRVLQQKEAQLKKLVTFAPPKMAEKVREAIFEAGGGHIGNYSECSFIAEGRSSFKPEEGANPKTGEIGKREEGTELRMEFIFQAHKEAAIITAMKATHEYEEVAYDVIPLGNFLSDTGSGIIGTLPNAVSGAELLGTISKKFNVKLIRHSRFIDRKIQTVAVCGGAGSFLLDAAKSVGAHIFISSDMKYHEFFDAEGDIILADIGHYESEQFTIDLLYDLLKKKFLNFALLKTGLNTNPVHYFVPGK